MIFLYSFTEATHIWLEKESSDTWLDTFTLISKNGLVALDSDLKERITIKGECLGAIYKDSLDGNIPSFMITAWDCRTKTSIVCEKEPAKFHATTKDAPNFPCIPNKQEMRKKRQGYALEFGLESNGDSFGHQRNLAKRNADGTSEQGIIFLSLLLSSKVETSLI